MATLAHHFEEGGCAMYPLVLVLVLLDGFTFERLVALARSHGGDEALTRALALRLSAGDLWAALGLAASERGATARVALRTLREGLGPAGRQRAARDEALGIEVARLERNMHWIPALGAVAGLFGLLGAMTGLSVPFGAPNADAASKATMLAKSISESMNATALGLLVLVASVVLRRSCSPGW